MSKRPPRLTITRSRKRLIGQRCASDNRSTTGFRVHSVLLKVACDERRSEEKTLASRVFTKARLRTIYNLSCPDWFGAISKILYAKTDPQTPIVAQTYTVIDERSPNSLGQISLWHCSDHVPGIHPSSVAANGGRSRRSPGWGENFFVEVDVPFVGIKRWDREALEQLRATRRGMEKLP